MNQLFNGYLKLILDELMKTAYWLQDLFIQILPKSKSKEKKKEKKSRTGVFYPNMVIDNDIFFSFSLITFECAPFFTKKNRLTP